MPAYYNEIDPFVANWLEWLVKVEMIADGVVDRRSIKDVMPSDLNGFTQCHFFAGIGGWSYALRLTGWPDNRPVWTGSCPCQPFSGAGLMLGENDDRHLWPSWFDLIAQCQPPIIFGEQVASPPGREWLDTVSANLEALDYAIGAADLCAAGIGAPHIRQRLWFVAESTSDRYGETRMEAESRRGQCTTRQDGSDVASGVSNTKHPRSPCTGGNPQHESSIVVTGNKVREESAAYGLANPDGRNTETEGLQRSRQHGQQPKDGRTIIRLAHDSFQRCREERANDRRERPRDGKEGHSAGLEPSGDTNLWALCEWLPYSDGRSRPVEPGTFPLAHGIPRRVGRLRGYGNAIVPQVAAEFIGAYLDTEQ